MDILENIPLKEHTTLRLGGNARFFVSVHSVEELREALSFAGSKKIPVYILGGGSNVLFTDDGWDGLVIHISILGREYDEDSKGDARVTVGAGEIWDQLVEETVSQGLWGLENLSRIPGTVGAAPVQNIGAYGMEVKDVIDWIEVLDIETKDLHIFSVDECKFGYRDSIFKHSEGRKYIILRVTFRLSTYPKPKLDYKDLREYFSGKSDVSVSEVRSAINKIRERKFPNLTHVGTAGSFFKNPIISKTLLKELSGWLDAPVPFYDIDDNHVKVPLAWVFERLGLKGKKEGSVGCWEKQPLVLVHYGGGTSKEFLDFVGEIMQMIKVKTNIKIEPEVNIVFNPDK
jgi:UDP-N-acetylmuramate dehydrogenase